MNTTTRWVTALLIGAFIIARGSPCVADRFLLKDGRALTGMIVGTDSLPASEGQRAETRLTIEMEPGVQMQVLQSELVSTGGHVKVDAREKEYLEKVAKLGDSAESHYRAAIWCAEQNLRDLAHAHYLRALDLDPDHKEARAAVKHTKDATTGRWIKREDEMFDRGKVFYKGRWQFPEYIPMEDQLETEKKEKVVLQKEINRLHNDAMRGVGAKSQQAIERLAQVDNPMAIEFIALHLTNRQRGGGTAKTSTALKHTYIGVLSKFDHPAAALALAQASIADNDQSVRTAALDVLVQRGRNVAIPLITRSLRSSNNEYVNRAGFALGQLNASEVILQLIDALITKHEFQDNSSENYSTGGLAVGGSKKRVVDLQNESVFSALAQITGQGGLGYGYDKAMWKSWYASVYAQPVDDLRRDP